MAGFDPYTKKILLEAIAGSTGSIGRTGKKVKTTGGFGGGAPKIKETKVRPGSKASTIMFGDTKMPPGAGIYGQAAWANYARMLNKAMEGTTAGGIVSGVSGLLQSLPGLGGSKGQAISNIAGAATKVLGMGGGLPGAAADFAVKQAIRSGAASAYLSGFGKLGSAVTGKIPGLAAVGIDPLEWSLKAFGADAALQGLAGVPAKTQAALQSSMGYLQKGKSRGIY
jgi:hypothetical protein